MKFRAIVKGYEQAGVPATLRAAELSAPRQTHNRAQRTQILLEFAANPKPRNYTYKTLDKICGYKVGVGSSYHLVERLVAQGLLESRYLPLVLTQAGKDRLPKDPKRAVTRIPYKKHSSLTLLVLKYLSEHQGTSVGQQEIADAAGYKSRTTISSLMQKLRAERYFTQRGTVNARYWLTDKGKAYIASYEPKLPIGDPRNSEVTIKHIEPEVTPMPEVVPEPTKAPETTATEAMPNSSLEKTFVTMLDGLMWDYLKEYQGDAIGSQVEVLREFHKWLQNRTNKEA